MMVDLNKPKAKQASAPAKEYEMNKSYVAIKHFEDTVLGRVTRRQILEGLTEEKALELIALGVVSSLAFPSEVQADKPLADPALNSESKKSKRLSG